MAVRLNHTIVAARDEVAAAGFATEILFEILTRPYGTGGSTSPNVHPLFAG